MVYSVNMFISNFEDFGDYDSCYGFYDWFCSEKTLKARAKSFVAKLKFLVNEKLINGDENYVWFKNNCPVNGSLYDDMRISNIKADEFKGGFCPATGHYNVTEKASLWYFEKVTGKNELVERNFLNWKEMKKALKTDENLRSEVRKHFA